MSVLSVRARDTYGDSCFSDCLGTSGPFFGSPMVIVACVSDTFSFCVLVTRLIRFASVVRASLPMVPFGSGEAYFP